MFLYSAHVEARGIRNSCALKKKKKKQNSLALTYIVKTVWHYIADANFSNHYPQLHCLIVLQSIMSYVRQYFDESSVEN